MVNPTNQTTLNTVNILEDFVKSAGTTAEEWQVVYVWASKLETETSKSSIAKSLNSEMAAASSGKGRGLVLGNNDVMMLMRDKEGDIASNVVGKVASVIDKMASGNDAEEFCKSFNLKNDFVQFVSAISGVPADRLMPHASKPKAKKAEGSGATFEKPRLTEKFVKHLTKEELAKFPEGEAPYQPFGDTRDLISPQQIAFVEHLFLKADVSNFIRNQPVFEGDLDQGFVELFDEMFISIDFLSKHIKDKFVVTADKWLFQYLTRTLDNRLLNVLGTGGDAEKKKIGYSINLNVATLLSESFLIYDEALPPRTRRSQIIELQAFDLMQHMGDYLFLRNFLQSRGYKICVDGVDAFLFEMMDWEDMKVDFIKIIWNKEYLDFSPACFTERIPQLTKPDSTGPGIILCRCDDENAIRWGMSLGIQQYQGWYLDGRKREKMLRMRGRSDMIEMVE